MRVVRSPRFESASFGWPETDCACRRGRGKVEVVSDSEEFYSEDDAAARPPDPMQDQARAKVEKFIKDNAEKVFFSRQIEIFFEDEFFHWVTNRAIRDLEGGLILSETRPLKTGSSIKLLWNKSYRYYKRGAAELVKLVEEYADPNIGSALGLHGETMVLTGFALKQFVTIGHNTNEFRGKKWTRTNHDLDFIFERDARAYGVEVKNMLGYMEQDEFRIKIELCRELGIVPLFVARMLPRTWIEEVRRAGGFALILKWQLYPPTHKDLAKRVQTELGLPVDAPRALAEGTMARFVSWHVKKLVN